MDELKFAVIGNPVSHSLSPDIHLFFASQFQLERYTYKKIKSNENNFEKDINDFFIKGGMGLNVTVPFIGLAYNLCDDLVDNFFFRASYRLSLIHISEPTRPLYI